MHTSQGRSLPGLLSSVTLQRSDVVAVKVKPPPCSVISASSRFLLLLCLRALQVWDKHSENNFISDAPKITPSHLPPPHRNYLTLSSHPPTFPDQSVAQKKKKTCCSASHLVLLIYYPLFSPSLLPVTPLCINCCSSYVSLVGDLRSRTWRQAVEPRGI